MTTRRKRGEPDSKRRPPEARTGEIWIVSILFRNSLESTAIQAQRYEIVSAHTRVILVTGGTGFLGRRVVARLAAAGHPTRVLTRQDAPLNLPADVEARRVDLLDGTGLEAALADVTIVIHLAGTLEGPRITDLNVFAARHLAAAARKSGVRRFVHCSSAGVYGDGATPAPHKASDAPRPQTRYEQSKLDGEIAVREGLGRSVPWLILRPTGLYGPGRPATRDFLALVERRRVWLHGPSRVIVHPCFVEDAAQAIVRAAERDVAGRVLNVAGERALPYRDLIAAYASRLGVHARQVAVPSAAGRALALADRCHLLPTQLARLARPIVNRAVDAREAMTLLSVVPVPFTEGLSATVSAYRSGSW
jgi:NADH dehydrogenase